MGVMYGVNPTWGAQTNEGRTHIATKGIVQSGLVLNLDAGVLSSYPGSGNTWTDLSGNGNNGTLVNGTGFNSANGGSLVFDGSNDYVELGNILNIGTGQFTLEYYGRATASTNNYTKIASKGAYANGGWTVMHGKTPSGTYIIGFTFGSGGTDTFLVVSDPVLVNTTYHAAVTRDASNIIRTYLNGSFRLSLTSTFDFTTNTYNYNIGRSGFGENFTGNVYNWRHYNRALTATEIQQNYLATKSRYFS